MNYLGYGMAAVVGACLAAPAAAHAQYAVAGTLYVDLRATNSSAGTLSWINQGTLGNFGRQGAPVLVTNVLDTGIPGLLFNGTSDVYVGPTAVADIAGANNFSVETWTLNPYLAYEETVVSWGRRDATRRNMGVNFGSSLAWGAATYFNDDLGWGSADLIPSAGEWHHMVLTYDGSTLTKMFVDGVLRVQKNLGGVLVTEASYPINVGCQRNGDGTGLSFYYSGYINSIRVHGGLLSNQQVLSNYLAGPCVIPPSGPVKMLAQPADAIVTEGSPVKFTVLATGTAPIAYQWVRNGAIIAGASNSSYSLAAAYVPDDNSVFSVIASNVHTNASFSVTSSNALLRVLADTTPPTLSHAYCQSTSAILLAFSEPLAPATATNLSNYSLAGPGNAVLAQSASLDVSGSTVLLNTTPLVAGTIYTVTMSNLTDRAFVPNPIAPGTAASVMATPLSVSEIGRSASPGWMGLTNGALTLSSSGADIGGATDQCTYAWQLVSGNFDCQLRLQGLELADVWSKAGLMARTSLASNSAFAAALATPSMSGAFFEYRTAAGGQAAMSGSFPVNYPQTWLRLQRTNNVLTGFGSFDGQVWTALGSASLTAGTSMYLGVAVSCHNSNRLTVARFSDYTNTISLKTGSVAKPPEPLGPCSRRTGLVISEIMYKPAARADGRNLEFVEIHNSNPYSHDLGGYQLSGDARFTFSPGTTIPGGGFLVVAAKPADMENTYGLTGVRGPYTNSLKTAGTVALQDETGGVLLSVSYEDTAPWPVAASGTGHSIVLARPSYGEGDPRAWSISGVTGGSPGTYECFQPTPLRAVVINEILAHTEDPAQPDFVELYNHSNQTNDLSGCILTDSVSTNKFVIPAGTRILPRGFLAFASSELGFGLSASGQRVYFKNPGGNAVLDAVAFGAQADSVSSGRFPDGSDDFHLLSAPTPNGANSGIRIDDIAINEIMYHPISGNDDDQYVELYNKGTNTVDVSGWSFASGIGFTFPSNTVMGPDSYLVVARNRTNLLAHYGNLTTNNTLGDFSGRLSHGGERLTLAMPQTHITTNNRGLLVTNLLQVAVDEVTWQTGGRWGSWADGGGSSLELIDPRSNHRLAASWADSDESAKSAWTNIETTGVLDQGANYDAGIFYAQIGLLEAGECLVDNIEVRPGTAGNNLAQNPSFESGLANWSLMGDHSRSSLEIGAGYGGSGNALHLRTGNRMWTGANAAQVALANSTLASGQTATLRFKARWLHGWPEALLRLNGNWLEATGRLPVPPNLGTPGARNSRAAINGGPALFQVAHAPSMPAAAQACVVTARVFDPDGLASLTLNYRVDPSPTYVAVPMADNGAGGDEVAGDGVHTATIPGQAAGATVAFMIRASDTRGADSRFPSLIDDNGPPRECVARFGEPSPTSCFGTYHLWLTQTNVNRWINLPVLSNEDVDGTVVYGSRVIYNMGAHYAGSPYHQGFDSPVGAPCHYNWGMPKDDQLLGATSFNKLHWVGNDIGGDPTQNQNDTTLQREQAANTFLRGLGVPWVYRRYVAVFVNGVRRGVLMEDAIRPTSTVPDQYFPGDTGGILYKVQPWFEFGPAPQGSYTPWNNMSWAMVLPYKTTGNAYKTARYRWNYEARQTPDTMSNYTNWFRLIDTAVASSSTNYVPGMLGQANMENWMRLVAANHAAGNWDCWGVQNGQNIYLYSSPNVKWTTFMFDFSIVLGNSISWGPGENMWTSSDSTWAGIYANPTFRRMYLRALKELVNGAMRAGQLDPLLDAKYSAMIGSGLTSVQSPAPIKAWVASARSSIAAQVAAEDTNAFSLSSNVFLTGSNTVQLSGTAPVEITAIAVNEVPWPLTWTTALRWTLAMPAVPGSNVVTVIGYDRFGQVVPGTSNQVTVISTGPPPESPVGNIVINEILYNPAVADGAYVELYNRSSNTVFDLSNWQFKGLGYAFPPATLLMPRSYLVLAKDRAAFTAAYGSSVPVFDVFPGTLQTDGETLTLTQPGPSAGQEVVVSKVKYESGAPWPVSPTASGASLQLIDSAQDQSRVCNWASGGGWQFASFTGIPSGNTLNLYLNVPGDVYIDDMTLVRGTVAGVGSNYLVNGDFERALTNGWKAVGTATNSTVGTAFKHGGNSCLHLVATSPAGTSARLYQTPPGLAQSLTHTLSFWYLPAGTNLYLTNWFSSSFIWGTGLKQVLATPGASNSVTAVLPAIPPLWINEVEPLNVRGLTNSLGQPQPWIELYNAGTNPASLEGLYLAKSYTNLASWAFPTGAIIQPGEFKVVFADAQTNLSSLEELHAGFRLDPTNGSAVLSRFRGGVMEVLDYVNYEGVPSDASYGSVPDGQPFARQVMTLVTPGGPNNGASAPIAVWINEWMASNTRTLPNPAGGGYDDWFELYNPNGVEVDLGGWSLANSLTNATQFVVPSGYRVGSNGFLVVWADGKPGRNSTNSPALHVNFKLAKGGDTIALYAPDGRLVDAVVFGTQENDISQGRYPDGTTTLAFMATPTPGLPNMVAEPPQPELGGLTLSSDGTFLSFTFATVAGYTYVVEYKDALDAWEWVAMGDPYLGTGAPILVTAPVATNAQRFFRIVMR